MDHDAIDLVSKLLVLEPEKRLSPIKALMHPFFDDLYKEDFLDKYEIINEE